MTTLYVSRSTVQVLSQYVVKNSCNSPLIGIVAHLDAYFLANGCCPKFNLTKPTSLRFMSPVNLKSDFWSTEKSLTFSPKFKRKKPY